MEEFQLAFRGFKHTTQDTSERGGKHNQRLTKATANCTKLRGRLASFTTTHITRATMFA